MEKLGLSYKNVEKADPGVICCSITGFGPTGPLSHRPGYDVIIAAMYGLMSITGSEESGPVKPGVALTDVLTGTLANSAILAALHRRNATGKGQCVDVSLMEAQLAGLVNIAGSSLNTDMHADTDTDSTQQQQSHPKRWGTAHASIVPYQAFMCSCGEALIIGAGNDVQFQHLCQVLGADEDSITKNDRFATNAKRVQHRNELIPLLEQLFLRKTRDGWLRAMADGYAGCFPHGAVRSVSEAFACEQALHRDMVMEVVHEELVDPIRLPGMPVKYSSTCGACSNGNEIIGPISISRSNDASGTRKNSCLLPPPMLGEHTREILHNVLNMSDYEIRELEMAGVISCWQKAGSRTTQK